MSLNINKGSEWGVWDLQVQTILDNRYVHLKDYYLDVKNSSEEKWNLFTDKVGGEVNALLYDSKEYFNDNRFPKKDRCINYIRTTFAFIEIFKPYLKLIGITDHNYYDDLLIDEFYNFSQKNNCKLLCGVEINSEGIHLLIYFDRPPYQKRSFSEGIKNFLSKIDIHNPLTNGVLTVSPAALITNVIPEIREQGGFFIYPHCNSDKGLFQDRGKTDKTHLSNIYNLKSKIVLQSNSKESIVKVLEYIEGQPLIYKSKPICTIASDARSLKEIGNSDKNKNYLWIKANPTFEGLRQIAFEADDRVFIGAEPEIIKRVRENRLNFINSIKISQIKNYDERSGVWFKDIDIPINPGLVAIIGNKGQGKSAIADILGLCGNSYRYKDFSFLKEDRFLKDGLAEKFEAALVWESGEIFSKNLGDNIDYNSPERVRYIPQNFFERLTNNLIEYEFEKTLKNIVFSYLPEDQKSGKNSFEELINHKNKNIERNVLSLKRDLTKFNEQIILLEKKSHPDYKSQISSKLILKKKELELHAQNIPNKVEIEPKTDEQQKLNNELSKLNSESDHLLDLINENEEKIKNLTIEIDELQEIKNEINAFDDEIKKYKTENAQRISKYGLDIDKIFKVEIDFKTLDVVLNTKVIDLKNTRDILVTLNEIEIVTNPIEKQRLEKISIRKKEDDLKSKIESIKQKLSEPEIKHQDYLEKLKKWKEQKKIIEGSINEIDSLKWLEKENEYLNNELVFELKKLRDERINKTLQIYSQLNDLINIYTQIKKAIDPEIDQYKTILGEYNISIEASLKLDQGFYDKFLSYVHKNVAGSFRGKDESKHILSNLINSSNFNSEAEVINLLNKFIEYFEYDKRENYNNKPKFIKDQILEENDWLEFYNYIFSLDYVEPFYELRISDKKLTQLSPGEKGALLFVFYLLLDKEDIPLIIDQPEENLDNESIYKILTHFIKLTKKKRQVIIVTHNPNLAIVGDAEQIIFVSIDKEKGNNLTFEAGAIENPIINKHASDVLEGTLKAFDIRRLKYFKI
jgi:ABC-type lipoprotein export system ATPase subunit